MGRVYARKEIKARQKCFVESLKCTRAAEGAHRVKEGVICFKWTRGTRRGQKLYCVYCHTYMRFCVQVIIEVEKKE